MSFILDALRKAERDKHRGAAPNIDDVMHAPPAPVEGAGHRQPLALLALVLGLLALVLWLLPETHRRLQEGAAPDADVTEADDLGDWVPAAQDAPATPVSVAPALIAEVADTAADEPQDERVAELAVVDAEPPPSSGLEEIEVSSFDELLDTPDPVRERAPRTAETSPVAEPQGEAAPVASPPDPVPAPAASAAEDAGPKALGDMPDGFRAAFPDLTVDVHVFNPDASRRWVLVGGKRYREGQALPAGARLDAILAQGIIVGFRGEQILLPVGQ